MAAGSYGGILPVRNTDLNGGDNLQECHRDLPEVYADNWLDVMDHRNMDIHLAGAVSQDPYQCGEEVELTTGPIRMNRDGVPITSYKFKKSG